MDDAVCEQVNEASTSATPITNATPPAGATPITNATPRAGATPITNATPPADARRGINKRNAAKRLTGPGGKKNKTSLGNTSQTLQDDKSEKVKQVLDKVLEKLTVSDTENNEMARFLRESIEGLKPDKKEVVGVFGRSGVGKSSLINAVIKEENLLPSGSLDSCTSVIIEVEGSHENEYKGAVEFISEEDFNNDLNFLYAGYAAGEEGEENDDDDDDDDDKSKMKALFGNKWKNSSLENLKASKPYKEIIKNLKKKTVEFSSPVSNKDKFCEKLKKYTTGESEDDENEHTWLWPVVKKVTIYVPNNNLLRYVTLVDLPGNGDCNKTRNDMWMKMLRSCGTVWVVNDMNRVNTPETRQILESACKHMGHGGECRYIHYICTKLDLEIRQRRKNNPNETLNDIKNRVKSKVRKNINDHKEFRRHFSDDCFKVFTVSAEAYEGLLEKKDTEIPELQDVIQNLNSQKERASRYVSSAYGILSLIKGARNRDDQQIQEVHKILYDSFNKGLKEIEKVMSGWNEEFEKSLTEGVSNAKASCEQSIKSLIIDRKNNQAFHKTLSSVVNKNGVHKPKRGKEINLNTTLSLFLTKQIDQLFRGLFPNDQKPGSIYSDIQAFSLNTKGLREKYPHLILSLRFLEQEEDKLKKNVCQEILNRKKSIYNCLTETVEREMQPCYEEAKTYGRKGTLQRTREKIMQHLEEKKTIMFDQAKDVMLGKLKELMDYVTNEIQAHMDKVINLSLSHDADLPDISEEFSQVEESYLYVTAD